MWSAIMGVFSGFKTYIIFGLIIAAIVATSLIYFRYSQNKIAELNKTIASQKLALDTETATIKKLNDNILNTQLASDDLNKKFNEIEKNTSTLTKEFSDHDLGAIAQKKPGMIEKLTNDATKKILKEFEDMTNPSGF